MHSEKEMSGRREEPSLGKINDCRSITSRRARKKGLALSPSLSPSLVGASFGPSHKRKFPPRLDESTDEGAPHPGKQNAPN